MLRQSTFLGVFLLTALPLFNAVARADEETREVKADAITLVVPADWKQQEPSNRLRLTQFEIPAAGDEAEPAELSVFAFGSGGSVTQHVERWLGQFEPDGRKSDAKQGKSPHGQYVYVDVSGTYKKPVGPPILRQTKPMPGARMLAVMIAVEKNGERKGNYFLKMVGDQQTVAANLEAFRTAFGAAKEEEAFQP